MSEGRHVLLVEDEVLIALDTADILTEAGYTVVGPATTVEQAIALSNGTALAAAVLDVNLNGTLVWPAAEHLTRQGVPIVLLSGFGASLDVPASLQAAPRFGKPIRAPELVGALASIVSAPRSV